MTPIPQVKSKFRTLILLAGFGFLYIPILLLIIYSFNESRLVTRITSYNVCYTKLLRRSCKQQIIYILASAAGHSFLRYFRNNFV